MPTYKEKTQTWKFGPVYPRGIYWLFEILSILSTIAVIIAFTKGAILLPFILSPDFIKSVSSWGFFILLFALAIMVPSFLFVFIYSPREVHLTYDEIILMRGFWGLMKKRIPYCQIREVEIVYSGKTFFAPDEGSETLFSLAKHILKTNMDKIVKNDKDFMISLSLSNGKTVDFQVEEPQEFAKLVREKMVKFGVQVRGFDAEHKDASA